MDFNSIVSTALPVVFIIVGIALVWLLVEVVFTVRKARQTIDDVKEKIEPTLANAEEITTTIKPAIAKVDPLVERVSLTVDAANLEIMRVDQILENVGDITDGVSNAVSAVDAVTNAPREIVTNVSNRIRDAFKPRQASNESVAIGERRAEQLREAKEAGAEPEALEPAADAADEEPAPVGKHAAAPRSRKERAEEHAAARDAVNEAVAGMADALVGEKPAPSKQSGRYVTYDAPADADADGAESR